MTEPLLSFAGLLRQLRNEARLTQEELAEAAGLSPRSVSDLERGINRTARKDTAVMLADALSLNGQVRVLFVAAARGRAPAAEVLEARLDDAAGRSAAVVTRSLPRDIGSFTGRAPELARLLGTLADVAADGEPPTICLIDGMAGVGKTTLAVHAAHRLTGSFPDGQFFLPLHAHTPGQRPVSPADALASLLMTAGVAVQQIPPGTEARAGRWRDHVAGKKILLLLDDAAGHEQVRPLLPGTSGSLVLVTSRRLDELYDHHLIAEPAPGRYVLHDLLREYARALAAADDAAEIHAAAGRLLNYYAHVAAAASRHIATWTTAGGRLPPTSPPASAPQLATSSEAAAWLESERPNLHAAVNYAATKKMPLYAIAIAAAMGGFLRSRGHWDQAAEQYQTALIAAREAGDLPGQAGVLDELGLLQQLTSDYPAATATLAEAIGLFRDLGDLPGQAYAVNHLGLVQVDVADYPAAAASHRQALELARDAGDQLAQAVSLIDLGMVQQMTGDYPTATTCYERALPLARSVGSTFDEADALCELGAVRRLTGDYPGAITCERQALELFRHLGDRLGQGWALDELGRINQLTGDYPAATASLAEAIELFRDLGDRHGLAKALNSLGELLLRTSAAEESRGQHAKALAIARELGTPGEQARALEGIGRSLLRSDPAEAATHLREALEIYQKIGAPEARGVRDALHGQSL